MNTFEKVYKVVLKIPRGKVLTYGNVGIVVGVSPRVVGYAMHANKNGKIVPCHRVVFRDGSLTEGYAFGGKDVQRKLLVNEGISFIGDKVDLESHLLRG